MSFTKILKENIHRFLREGRPLCALPLSEILWELNPNDQESCLLRAQLQFEAREYESVIQVINHMLCRNDKDMDALSLGMKASFELGELKQCVKFAKMLVDFNDKNVCALCYIGKCAELSGDTGEAISYYQKALETDPFCGDAFIALMERKLLSPQALCDFLDTLCFPPEAEALRKCYKAKLVSTPVDYVNYEEVPYKLVLLRSARHEYVKNNLHKALALITEFLDRDPYDRDAVCLYLCILVDIKSTPKLFEEAHFLSKAKSRTELAVYAIGCYYYSLSNYERAGRYFCRATELDSYFSEAWIAYGHCYSKLEEGEQALGVYRRAMSFFPGLASCTTFVGMQYSRICQWSIAIGFFETSLSKSPRDPLVLNEIAVLLIHTKKINEALHYLRQAYQNLPSPDNSSEHHDSIIYNLATAFRKVGEYGDALTYYKLYVKGRPNAAHAHTALGFTYHLSGNFKAAISHYHTALSIKSDSFCRDMLDRVLATDFGRNIAEAMRNGNEENSSPYPKAVSFSTIPKPAASQSRSAESAVGSPMPSVDRSLAF